MNDLSSGENLRQSVCFDSLGPIRRNHRGNCCGGERRFAYFFKKLAVDSDRARIADAAVQSLLCADSRGFDEWPSMDATGEVPIIVTSLK